MAITFPTTLDAFTNPTSADDLNDLVGGRYHDELHADVNDAIEAVQAKLGVNPSGISLATGRGSMDALHRKFYHPESYGAVPETWRNDGKMAWGGTSATSKVLTSATASFSGGDVGKSIVVYRGGPSNYQALYTTIASVDSSTQVTLTSGQQRSRDLSELFFSYGSDQTTAFQAAITAAAANDSGPGCVLVGPGSWLVGTLTVHTGVAIRGGGWMSSILRAKPSLNAPILQNDPGASTTVSTTAAGGATAIVVASASGFSASKPVTIRLDTTGFFTSAISSIVGTTINLSTALPSTVTAGSSATVTQRASTMNYIGDLMLVGSKTQQTSGSAHGIYLTGTAPSATPMNDWIPEKQPHVHGVYMYECKDDGYHAEGGSSATVSNCFAYYCDGIGFRSSYDHKFVNCEQGHSGSYGWSIANSSVRLVGCKSWYAGNIISSQGHGFYLNGVSTGGTISLVGCEAQDNKGSGFHINSCAGVMLAGCAADSNNNSTGTGTSTSSTLYSGFTLNNATDCVIESCTSVDRFSTAAQTAALLITGTSVRNRISITHRSPNVTGANPIHASSTSVSGNAIKINNQEGHQAASFSGTSYTPRIYDGTVIELTFPTTTATYTINAPDSTSKGHEGMMVSFIISRTATGTPTLAWNGVWKVASGTPSAAPAASMTKVFTFLNYDGTNWRQMYDPVETP